MIKKLSQILLFTFISLIFLGGYSTVKSSENTSDNSDILDLIIPLIPAFVKANNNSDSILSAEKEGFQISFDKVNFDDYYVYKLNINKPSTKDISCYIGKGEKSRIDDKAFCTVSEEYSGRVGQHSIGRSSIDHPSGDYFLTIITDDGHELRSKPYHLPPKKPIYESTPSSYTTLDSVEMTLTGEPNTTIIVNGNDKGSIPSNGKAKIILDTSGKVGVKEFVIALKDDNGVISETSYPIKVKKLANIESIKLSPENIQMSVDDKVALNNVVKFGSGTLSASDFGFNKVVTALISYQDGSEESLSAIELDLEINDTSIVQITGTVGSLPSGIAVKMPILQGLKEGTTTLTAKLDSIASNQINLLISNDAGQDKVPPKVVIHGDNPLNLVTGQTYFEVSASAFDDIDGVVSVHTQGTVDTNTVGTYEITYSASDKAGNTTTKTRKVIVKKADKVNPTSIMLLRSFYELIQGDIVALQTEIIFPEIGSKDIDDLNIKGLMVYAYYDGEYIPKLIPAKDVTLKLSDSSIIERSTETITDKASGNSVDIPVLRALKAGSISVTATIGTTKSSPLTIKVNQLPPDTIAPVITLKGEAEVTLIEGSSFLDEGATAKDDRDGEVDVTVKGAVNDSIVGTYILTYTAKDKAGNSVSTSRTVEVREDTFIKIYSIYNTTLGTNYICRKDDEIIISGSNLPQNTNANIKFIDNTGKEIIAHPSKILKDKLHLICPDIKGKEYINIEISEDNKKSLPYGIQVLENNSPFIESIDYKNNSLSIKGKVLYGDISIYINNIKTNINNNQDNFIPEITIPADINQAYVYLEKEGVKSNGLYISSISEKTVNVETYNNSINTGDLYIHSSVEKSGIDTNGLFKIKIDHISDYTFVESDIRNHTYLSTVILPGDEEITLNSLNTAVYHIWTSLYLKYFNTPQLVELRENLYGLQEVKDIAVFIDNKISSNPYYLESMDAELIEKISIAKKASYVLLKTIKSKKLSKRSLKEDNSVLSAKIYPNIQDDISFKENGTTGNLIIENDTSLSLSVKMTDNQGNILLDHKVNELGLGIIPPQKWGWLNIATETPLLQPQGINCDIEVITPNLDKDFYNEINNKLRKQREDLILDAIWTSISKLPDLPKEFTKEKFLGSIVNKKLLDEISRGNYENIGSIVSENFRKSLEDTAIKYIFDSALDTHRIIKQIIGRLNLIKNIVDAIHILHRFSDKLTLDGIYYFSAEFPPRIKSFSPNKLLINQTTEDGRLYFTIKGTGLSRNVKMNLFQKDAKDIDKNSVNVSISNFLSADEMEVSVSLIELREYYDAHIIPTISSTRVWLSLGISDFFQDDPSEKVEVFDKIEVNNDLSISSVSPEGGIGGEEIVLRGTGFLSDASENTVALGHTIEGQFIVKHYLEVKKVEKKLAGSDDKITVEIPLNAKNGLYELRSNTFDSIHWSNSVSFKILNMDIDIESIYPNKIDLGKDTIVSIFLSCHDDDNKKIDCNKVSKFKEPDFSWDTEWFNHEYFLTYHSNSEFIIEFTGLSKYGTSKYIKSKLVDVQDNGNHLRFEILSKDIIDPDSYKEGYLLTTPYVSVRFVMNAENKIKQFSRDEAIIINQKFGTLGYYDSFIRSSSPSSNPQAWEPDDGKVGRWDDSLFWSQYHNRYVSGFIESGTGQYEETFKRVSEYCNKKGMQLPTYQDFSELVDPSRENLMSPVFNSYFFSTTSYYGSAYWLGNGNRIVQSGTKVYEQDASLFRDKYVYHTDVKCIQ